MIKKIIRITTVPISLEKLLEGQLSYMSEYYDVVAISAEKERLEQFGKQNGVRTKYLNLTRKITPGRDIISVIKLIRFLKKEKPAIVHSHTPKAGIVGMMAAYFAGVPCRVHTVAGLPLMEATGPKRSLLNFVEKLTYKFATHVYPNSKGLQDFIVDQKFCKPEKLAMILDGSSNGIDTEYFDPAMYSRSDMEDIRAKLGLLPNDVVFIFVGRLVGDKGINELVSAFDRISTRHPSVKLLLVGPLEPDLDPLRKETSGIIEKNKRIITIGYQADVRPYFGVSDVLVFPSYREGFPNVVMQALAMGLPAIVSDINGCNELIEDRKNGLIIPVKDEVEVERAMTQLLDDPVLMNDLKSAARDSILSRYDRKVFWEALRKTYEKLMNDLKN